MSRHQTLKFKGEYIERKDDDGNVIISGFRRSIAGVPTRDLEKDDIDALSAEQYRDAVDSGLYVAAAAPKKAASAKSSRKPAAAQTTRAEPKLQNKAEPAVENRAEADEKDADDAARSEPDQN